MKQIRIGVFETNSSSTHSITMCSKEDYDNWKKGKVLKCGDDFITREEAIEELKKDEYFNKYNPNFDFTDEESIDEALKDYEYCTYEQYFKSDYLESFTDTYTTKNGETVIAFGKYGYDG
ncbi:MAG TPA: hypothetical protein GXZ48_03565 [Acholeplasmataceae bacterium]|nr:hypothetical protein [Acholeplasmataceae bacterium]